MNGIRLEVKSTMKILGVTFDKQLYWKPHIKYLTSRCKRALNIIRCISNINWGADRKVILAAYKSLILPKLEYGSIVYGSACKSRLYQLEKIHKEGLRLAIGAFRTSPNQSIFCESGISSLTHRRRKLLLNYGVKIWSQPSHPNYPIIYNEAPANKTVGKRIEDDLDTLDTELPPIFPSSFNEIPPWTLATPKFHFECNRFKKENTSRIQYLQIFHEVTNKYENCTVIYTDGSKTNQGVGSAFFCNGETHQWALNPISSIFTAELYAILQALRFIETLDGGGTYLILSDSCSSLQALQNSYNTDPLIQIISTVVHILQNSDKRIIFFWVPGHIGIAGNELADTAARDATGQNYLNDIPLRPEDMKAYLKNKIRDKWNQEWNDSNHKLKFIKNKVDEILPFPSHQKREQVALTRLRIGHTHITSSYLLCGTRPPICDTCDVQLTVEHLLLVCSVYTQARNDCSLPETLQQCLRNEQNCLKTIQFLNETGLMKKV